MVVPCDWPLTWMFREYIENYLVHTWLSHRNPPKHDHTIYFQAKKSTT